MRSVAYSLNFELAVPWNKRILNVRLFSDRSKSECGKNKKVAQCDWCSFRILTSYVTYTVQTQGSIESTGKPKGTQLS